MRKNTEAQASSGATDSSVEAPVMGVERCGGVVPTENVRQPRKGEERARAVKPFRIDKRVVWEAWKHVKANRGAAGIDDESIEMFEANLKDNLYRVWNRMSSGSYFPPAVRLVEIPKKNGGVRTLGIPTVEDRIAQTVVKAYIEPSVEQLFHPDSYGYRFGKSALQAIEVTKERCLDRDSRRREAHACKQFTFLGYTFRPRTAESRYGKIIQCFLPGVSLEATKKMLRTIKSWKLTRQTPASIDELAARYNPILRGWWNYYGRFYKTALRRVFISFEATLARWARRKYKKLLRHKGRSFLWIWRVARRQPGLFVHWRAYGQAGGRAMGAV